MHAWVSGAERFPNHVYVTLLFLLVGILLGALVIADAIKPEAPVAVHALHSMGLRVLLLTGDNRRTAQAIAEEVSVRELLCQCES